MKTIIYNIGTLAGILPEGVVKLEGTQMNHVECIEKAYLVVEDCIITEFGKENEDVMNTALTSETEVIDAKGGYVMPCFCDSHTHIVYAGSGTVSSGTR